MKRILLVFGTRPEAIKMCPLAKELKNRPGVDVRVCVTGQHREMLAPILNAFSVLPDHDLSILRPEQSLEDITGAILAGLPSVLEKETPDLVLVHGDTTTAFAAALTCFYRHIPVGHVEAGLRTWDLGAPYPEEFNRRAVDLLSRWHFAPTEHARKNLLREGADPNTVFVTGNTGIDALKTTVQKDFSHPLLTWAKGKKLVLLTAHRRENLGPTIEGIFRAIRATADAHEDLCILYPVHLNPAVRKPAEAILGGHERIRLAEPMGVVDFHNILSRCDLVLTDSGGIQEEATALGKPVLVLRDVTERPEGVDAGALELAGTGESAVKTSLERILSRSGVFTPSPVYGDGSACRRIADILCG